LINRVADNSNFVPNERYYVQLLNINSAGDRITDAVLYGNSQVIGAAIHVDSDSTILVAGSTLSSSGMITTPNSGLYSGFLALLKRDPNGFLSSSMEQTLLDK
jgi:hypothetical protein